MKTQYLIKKIAEEVTELLLQKNADYGDTANNPISIFSKLDSTEALMARIEPRLPMLQLPRLPMLQL